MADLNRIVRKNVLELIPYSSARDEFKGTSGIFMDANENPFGSLNRYPDPYQSELKTAVSKLKGIPGGNIFLGNGSDEIIDLTIRIFCNPGHDKILVFPPTYGMYEVSASVNDARIMRIPLDKEFRIDMPAVRKVLADEKLKVIFICSPNNPTGNAMSFNDVEFIIKSFGGIVLVDEAYNDFSDKQSFLTLVDRYNNLIVMQTFSKAFGMAAARLGMAFTNPEIVKLFNKVKPPYNISTINQKAALLKLQNQDKVKSQVMLIKTEREKLAKVLNEIPMVEKVFPSDSNFLLVRIKDAGKVYNKLLSRNIIVRNRSSVIENCLRITVGKKSENSTLLKALKQISNEMNDIK